MQEIYSTKIKKNSQEKFLNISDLYLDKPLTAIYVISAYTDTTLIEELIKELKKKGTGNGGVKFKIFLDERQSRFTEGSFSKDFLIKLDNIISKAKNNDGGKNEKSFVCTVGLVRSHLRNACLRRSAGRLDGSRCD